jgi:3-isopropylmalate/(R)-2-methylmalate dehydratase small subunit
MTAVTRVTGRGLPLRGDDIDTDRIIPARYLRSITFDGLEQHVFEDDRKAAPHAFDDPRFQGASILVVNSNFGCGSSREHAPQALQRWGIGAVVGESFAEIFFGNALMIGLPCLTATVEDVQALMTAMERDPGVAFTIDLAAGLCESSAGARYDVSVPPNVRDAFLTGAWDTTGLLLDRYDDVDATAARLPYVSGF